MKAFDLDASFRWLFCMCHPDDEITVGAWIKRLTANGNEVHMSWTHHNSVRESEARNAAEYLGVPQENLYFFGATDGRVAEEMPLLIPKFEQMMKELSPDRVVTTAFEQGHIDHDATNVIVNKSFAGPVLETPLYHAYYKKLMTLNRFASNTNEEMLVLSSREQDFKKKLAKMYPSQTIWKILFWYEIMNHLRFQPSKLYSTERMRFQQHKKFLDPNLPPVLAKRVVQTSTWKRWQALIETLET